MALTFDFYTDVGLGTPIVSPILVSQKDDGTTAAIDTQVFLGSTTAGRKAQAVSDPGVEQVSVDVTDTTPGSSHLTTEIKLALTQGALTAATPGASLDLGLTILSSTPIEFWVRIDDATGIVSDLTELGFSTVDLRETVV